MARDSIRPFIVGLLLVYLLDPPVRWLARRGVRRTLAILIVYVVAIVAFIEFLNLTLTPLINELLRFVDDFPQLAEQLRHSSSASASCTRDCRSRTRSASGSMRSSPARPRAAVPRPSTRRSCSRW